MPPQSNPYCCSPISGGVDGEIFTCYGGNAVVCQRAAFNGDPSLCCMQDVDCQGREYTGAPGQNPLCFTDLSASGQNYAGIYPNAQRYALRMAFVPENAENGLLINFQVSEPGGTIVSTISPYGSPLGSQLYTLAGKSGPSPRVYILPVAEPGDFRVEITHEGPSNAGPARGKLYLFKTPKPFAEYWEQHNVLIPRVGESFDLTFTIDQLPTGDLTIPPKGTP